MFPILKGMRNKICQDNSVDFVYKYQELIQCSLWISFWSGLDFFTHKSIRKESLCIKESAITFVRVQ